MPNEILAAMPKRRNTDCPECRILHCVHGSECQKSRYRIAIILDSRLCRFKYPVRAVKEKGGVVAGDQRLMPGRLSAAQSLTVKCRPTSFMMPTKRIVFHIPLSSLISIVDLPAFPVCNVCMLQAVGDVIPSIGISIGTAAADSIGYWVPAWYQSNLVFCCRLY